MNEARYSPLGFPPKYAGGYQIGGRFGLRIMLVKKPIWLHRKMMWWFFGWEWLEDMK
jgi:hypothetical protein